MGPGILQRKGARIEEVVRSSQLCPFQKYSRRKGRPATDYSGTRRWRIELIILFPKFELLEQIQSFSHVHASPTRRYKSKCLEGFVNTCRYSRSATGICRALLRVPFVSEMWSLAASIATSRDWTGWSYLQRETMKEFTAGDNTKLS
jgi:hypothetical protein